MRVALTGGAYQARSLIANCQRCVNLYPEANPPDAPVPFTHYPCPGSRRLGAPPVAGVARCAYRATNGDLFYVVGSQVYFVSPSWGFSLLGTLAGSRTNIVSMMDNGTDIIIVDGTQAGYTINLGSRAFATITDPAFLGGDRVDFLDTFFLINDPGTRAFFVSNSNSITFDPLFIAEKETYADLLISVISLGQVFWLIGSLTSEPWLNSGAADFPFQRLPSVMVNHGCAAVYTVAKSGTSVFWLSQDLNGTAVVLMASDTQAARVSTHAIENTLSGYSTISDAIGFTYQQEGHDFYVLTFPTANATWVYDKTTNLWHERVWIDGSGRENRIRANCTAFAYDTNVFGDHETGTLYAWDGSIDTDDGVPMKFVRSFPHMVSDGRRVFYRQFIADMAVGTGTGTLGNPPLVSLRWSDTRGASWGNAITSSLGEIGEYLTSIQFQRLGMARDRIFELSWSGPGGATALNGAWVDTKVSAS